MSEHANATAFCAAVARQPVHVIRVVTPAGSMKMVSPLTDRIYCTLINGYGPYPLIHIVSAALLPSLVLTPYDYRRIIAVHADGIEYINGAAE